MGPSGTSLQGTSWGRVPLSVEPLYKGRVGDGSLSLSPSTCQLSLKLQLLYGIHAAAPLSSENSADNKIELLHAMPLSSENSADRAIACNGHN